MSTATTIDLVGDARKLGAPVVTGFTQGAHGSVSLAGPVATYHPTPGYVGADRFTYTVPSGDGQVSSAAVAVSVFASTPVCTIFISGPTTAVIGPPIHLQATASCNVGTPEVQWRHRIGTNAFTVLRKYSTTVNTDFVTTNTTAGTHQFIARVRSKGMTQTFSSNTLTVQVNNAVAPCTAVALDVPVDGSYVAPGAAVTLAATATCPVGTSPEYQYWVEQVGDASWTVLPTWVTAPTSFIPTAPGDWRVMVVARSIGSIDPFQVQSVPAGIRVTSAPRAVDDTLVVDEDTAGQVNVLANDADPNGDPLAATITTGPVAGTATIAAGVVTYTPAPDYHGCDSITYTVDDGHGNTATATVHITVHPVNDPPEAIHDFLTVAENASGSIDVVANDVDVDGDALTVTEITTPGHGTATLAGTVITYTPAPGYSGPDELEYTIGDGNGGASTASLFITVSAVNGAPTAVDDDLAIAEDTDGGIYLLGNDVDPDGDALTVIAFGQPAHGSASVVAGFASYHPDHDYNGPDAFTYTVADPAGAQSTATVHITVLAVNDPPVAAGDSAELDEDTGATIDVVANDADVDGDALAIAGVTQPAHGTVAIVSGHEVTYTPAADYNGADAFTYTVADPSGAQATATVTLAVAGVNDPPVAVADSATLDEDTAATLDVVANDRDVDGDALAITGIAQPAHGAATIVDATHLRYVPAANYHGPDAFGYTIADGHGGEASATVTLVVTPVNDAPVAADDTASLDEDTPASIDVVANDSDVDGDALAITGIAQPAHGVAEIADDHHVIYTPAADYHGADAFTYTVGDGHGGEAIATVTLAVASVNDGPVARGDAASVLEDGSVTIDVVANDGDVDGDPLVITGITQPGSGAVAIVDAHHVVYTPAPNFHGGDAFSYTIADPSGAQATAAVIVDVVSVNDPPIANADAAGLDEDTAITLDVVANDSDVDGDALAIASLTQPAHGLATLVDGHRVLYVPAPDYHGPDAFAYTISDGHGGEATAVVTVTVAAVNDAPVARADAASLLEDGSATIDVIANDSDVDGDELAIASVTQPAHGTATISDAHHVVYTPAPDFHGADAFGYTVADPSGAQATADVVVDVASVNDAPIANADETSLDEDTAVTLDVVANDFDVDGDALAITGLVQPAHGLATLVDGHRVLYVPAPDYHGPEAFAYTISDGHGGEATATVTVTVAPVNDAPVARADAASLLEDGSATIDVVANDSDVDGDPLAIASVTQPAHGAATISDPHHVVYTPAPNFHGADAFSYTIADPSGAQATAAVVVDVASVNDAPIANADAASLDEDTAVTVDVVANDFDVDGDALAIISLVQPAHGLATLVDGHRVLYVPAPDYHGPDAFGYTISDGNGGQATAQLVLDVVSVNDAPVAVADAASLDEDTIATVDVVANDSDVDGDVLAIAGITQPAHGAAAIGDAHHVQYTPAANYNGADSFTYTVGDGNGGQATATVTLAIAPVNDPPVAVADAASLDEDTVATVDVVANDSDVDGDTLAIAGITQPAHGAAVIGDAHHVQYTPAANYNGADSFTYTVGDGNGGQATATVTLAIAPVNDPPVAVADAASLDEDTVATVDVVANDSDVDGDTLTIAGVIQPAHGAATISDAHHVRYTPAANYHGPDSLQYTIGDGNGAQATATLTLTVASVNDAPVAANVTASTFDDTSVAVVLSASDVDGDSLTFAIAGGPAHGTLGPSTGNRVTYTPAAGFAGADGFTYTASDGQLGSAVATAAITVVRSVCGNGIREGVHEECDDGNAVPGDGCEAGCKLTCGSGTGADRASVDSVSGHCFVAYDGVHHSYQDAAALCAGFGGHLPTITSATEDEAAFAAVHAGDAPWLGGDDLAVEGTFHWTTGEAFGFTNFGAGKPDNAGNADCLQYRPDGTWTDASCAAATGTLCELEVAATTPAFATGGTGTRAVAIADFNGDGYVDVAAVNPASNTVGILLGNGAGGFVLQATYATGTGPTAVATGDFDHDGNPDLAIVNATANTVSILRGSASGAFTAGATFAVAAGATSVAVADFDQDGALDLAVAATSTVQVFHGNAGGGFTAPGAIAITGVPASIAAGDFDRDGRPDLAVTTPVAVLVVRGAAGGTFGLPVTLAVSTANRSVIAGDLDGDGNLDLAVANGAASVSVFFGGPSGVFTAPVTLTVAGTPLVVAAGDFDGDGGRDLVALTSGFATLFHGSGRTFTQAGRSITTGGTGASFAVAASVNGDAAQDLVVANATTSNAGILLGGAGGFAGAAALAPGTGATATSTVSGDFNGDGLADLAVVDPVASKVFVFLQTAGGGLVPSSTITVSAGANPTYAVVADFDGDGKLDLGIVNVGFSSVGIARGAGNGTFATPINGGVGTSPRRPAIGDFNGDGKPDLAVPAAVGNTVAILINLGSGRFGRAADVPVSNAPSAIVTGDFNGDGKKDLAIATTGEATVKLVLGHGDGTFGAATAFAVASAGQALAAGDLDGDGKLDLVATCTATNTVSILHGTGTGTFTAATSVATGAQPASVVAVDLDGDTRIDLVVGNAGSNDVTVLHSTGAGGFAAFGVGVGAPASSLTVVDLDHDGHLDITAASGSAFVTTMFSAR